MESTTEQSTKHGCYSAKRDAEPSRLSRALKPAPYSSDANSPTSPLTQLSIGGRETAKAHKLLIEQRRLRAVENARRTTYL